MLYYPAVSIQMTPKQYITYMMVRGYLARSFKIKQKFPALKMLLNLFESINCIFSILLVIISFPVGNEILIMSLK